MIAETVLNRQMRRLMNLPYTPTDPEKLGESMRELKRIVDRDVRSDEHLSAIIDTLIDHAAAFPPPSALVEAIEHTPDPSMAKGPLGCSGCKGTGWYSYTRNGYDFAKFCACELGQWKRASLKAHEEQKAQSRRSR